MDINDLYYAFGVNQQVRYNSDGESPNSYYDEDKFLTQRLRREPRNSPIVNGWRDPNSFRFRKSIYLTGSESDSTPTPIPRDSRFGFPGKMLCIEYNKDGEETRRVTRSEGLFFENPIYLTNALAKGHFRDRDEMEAIAITAAYNQLNAGVDFHAGIFIGSLFETFGFIGDTMTAFSQALVLLLKGKVKAAALALINSRVNVAEGELNRLIKRARRTKDVKGIAATSLDVISAKWLEIQFAWKPLIADMLAALKLIPTVMTKLDQPRITGRAVYIRKFDRDLEYSRTISRVPYGPIMDYDVYLQSETVTICRTDWVIGNPTLYTLSLLGLVNVLEVVYDLTPFSFVFDWVVPMNNWLSALTADAGLDYLGGSITTTSRAQASMVAIAGSKAYGNKTYQYEGNMGSTIQEVDTIRQAFGRPPGLRVPPVRYPTQLWHAITSAALLWQTKELTFGKLRK